MNNIKIGKHSYDIAGSYNELNAKQLVDMSRVLLMYYAQDTHSQMMWRYIREDALKVLMDFSPGVIRHNDKIRNFLKIDSDLRISILTHDEILPWVFEKPKITANIIKQISIKGKLWIGPYHGMCDVSAEEFVDNHIVSILYGMTEDEKWLNKLIASLYRPAAKQNGSGMWDWREPNDARSQEEREKIVATQVKPETKMAIWLQYTGHLEEFTSDKPKFFQNVKSGSDEDGAPDLQGYKQLILKMSGKQFGDYTQTARAKAEAFFTQIEYNIEAREEQERENRRK